MLISRATGYIHRNVEICAGCKTCEAVCSLSHEGVVSPALARTWVVEYVMDGRRIEGYTCRQCESPNCLQACPTESLHIDGTTGGYRPGDM